MKRSTKPALRIVGWCFIVGSIVCLLVSAVFYFRTRSFVATAVGASGVITRLREHESNDSTTYHPVFVFNDSNGNQHEIESSAGSNPSRHAVGDQVNVLYQLRHPDDAKMDGFFELWGVSVISGGVGAFDLLLGVGLLVAIRFIKTA